ncbi:MAG: sensor histidine kinase [Janthinobacterium lividum]
MKRQIRFLVLLMVASTLALLGLQGYWNYQAYQQAGRTFRREANEVLATAVQQESAQRQHVLRARYRRWLSDTSAVRIRAYRSPADGATYFRLADRQQFGGEHRQPYELGFQGYRRPAGAVDSTGRAFFIRRFLAGPLTRDLREGTTYFYTRRLGNELAAAYQADTIHRRYLARCYAQLLRQHDLATAFRLDFTRPGRPPAQTAFGTAAWPILLPGQAPQTVRAWFADPNRVYLARMKWVLLGSLGLVGIVISCFAYTLRALLSQERLALLKDDFVNNMTHELKTPVATIGVTAEALASGELGPATTADYLGIIRHQASRLATLIDTILRSAAAEQRTLALARRPLDLAAVLAEAIAQVQPRLAEIGSQLCYEAPLTPLPVLGDAVHLANVLATLLDNALKYGRAGGTITLWSGLREEAVVVRLTNEGASIPVQYQARIFEKFFRVPTGDRHDVPGNGLGLHYARTLLERHGGSLSVRSQSNATTFTLTLPLAHVTAPPTFIGR